MAPGAFPVPAPSVLGAGRGYCFDHDEIVRNREENVVLGKLGRTGGVGEVFTAVIAVIILASALPEIAVAFVGAEVRHIVPGLRDYEFARRDLDFTFLV